jgi:hypothetical protein
MWKIHAHFAAHTYKHQLFQRAQHSSDGFSVCHGALCGLPNDMKHLHSCLLTSYADATHGSVPSVRGVFNVYEGRALSVLCALLFSTKVPGPCRLGDGT